MLQTIAGAEVKTSQKLGFYHNLRLVVDCWKENWRSLLRGASPPSTRTPRSINLIITIALIIIIVSFALL